MKQVKIKRTNDENQRTNTFEGGVAKEDATINSNTFEYISSLNPFDPDKSDILNFQQDCLMVHNKYRQKHGVTQLELSEKLCNLAQEWVDYMANSGLVQQFKNIKYGLNTFVASGVMYNADDIIKAWYNEIDSYIYAKPGLTEQTHHFTQIIWKNTKYLGVGIRKKNRHTWVICVYDPPGNRVGGFAENVLPPTEPTVNADAKDVEIVNQQNEFIHDCLNVHNKYRANHGCPPLRLNNAMNDYAQKWANELSKYGSLRHQSDNIYGENLFLAANYDPTAEEVVKEWYDESQFYDYKNPNFTKETGNFTQVIWKDSTDLGVGIFKSGISTYIVCNYAPHGNILERFKANVPPPIDTVESISEISNYSEERLVSKIIVNEIKGLQESLKQRKTFEEQCLNGHNKYRALHGCPPLILDKIMSAYAQEWSEYLGKSKSLEHRPNNPYGENLFYATFHITGEDPVDKWYQEIQNYDFNNPGFHPSTGHFTQVIWKKTKRLGVGITIFNKITFVVCNYAPWGNVLNHFDKNVPPLLVHSNKYLEDIAEEKVDHIKQPLKSLDVRCVKVTNNEKKGSQKKQEQRKHSQTTKQSISANNNTKFEELCLQTHNKYRALHGCPPLKLVKYLNDFAMDWAKHLSKTKKFEHRPNNRYGENLYFGSGFRVTGVDPVTTWYNEIHDFDFLKPGFQSNTGHFTQLIWKESKEVGVAVINLGENTYVVCNYHPPGNVIGAFEDNVPMALEGPFSKDQLKSRNFASQYDPKQFAQEVLKLHNTYRAKHNSPPLTLSEELNKIATEWAKHLADTNSLKHREPPKYGENIFKASGWSITPDELMRMWYNEWKVYKFDQNEFVPNAGHFTQLIWKNSKTIGVGTAKRDRSMWIVVNYDPPGNFVGEFKDNVFPAT